MKKNQLLLAFYGDDFTGSTDAMEALAVNNYRTILFLEAPTEEMLKRFAGISCIGVAGTSRSKTPAEMERELRPVFERFAKIPVPIVHYKTCSTFDSAPEVGSIGKAIEVARDYFNQHPLVPLLVGAPALGRYTLFGNHFARMQETVFRLDRHPTMSRHPITPMHEADLRVHLARQTTEEISLMNILELTGDFSDIRRRFQAKDTGKQGVLLFDVLDEGHLLKCGQLIWERVGKNPQFVVGSSGVEYALTSYWESIGVKPAEIYPTNRILEKTDRILVISGSCSPITQKQIQFALEQGFHGIKISLDQLLDSQVPPENLMGEVSQTLSQGRSVIMYTAFGPDDETIALHRERFKRIDVPEFQSGEVVGRNLGKWTREILNSSGVRRVVIAGGDTSGFVTRELGVFALEMIRPISPGAPLCRGYSTEASLGDLELALKGGQMGGEDYFRRVLLAELRIPVKAASGTDMKAATVPL